MTAVWGELDGRTITFPMEVADFDAATLMFSVPADAAQVLLPGDAFEVVASDGVATLVVALCDYVDNPWGDYLEINLGFLARPAGAPADVAGSFVYRMPVDQEFTCRAGNAVMGFPKTVEDLSVRREDGRVTFAMADVLSVSFAEPSQAGEPTSVDTVSYSYLDGVPHETPLAMDLGTGLLDPADVVVELGIGPVADELRSLGLPKPPDFGTWGTGLTATFHWVAASAEAHAIPARRPARLEGRRGGPARLRRERIAGTCRHLPQTCADCAIPGQRRRSGSVVGP